MNVGHPPEDHGQVVRAVVQEVEEAEPQRHGSVTQRLQPDELAPLLLLIRPDQRLSLEINPGSEHRLPHWLSGWLSGTSTLFHDRHQNIAR